MISIVELKKFNLIPKIKKLKTFEATVKSNHNRSIVKDAIKNNKEFVFHCLNNENFYYINEILCCDRLIDFIILVSVNLN